MDRFIEIGCITKAHGIKGEVSIEFNADSPDLLWDSVYLSSPVPAAGHGSKMPLKEYTVKTIRMHKGRPLITLEGVPDRTAAELLRGQRIFIPKERLPALEDDEIYMNDLPGLRVLVRENEGPLKPLGEISSADIMGEQEIWTITTPDGQEILFPATEEFVELINLDEESVIINPPPGLLDIYLTPRPSSPKQ